MPYLKEITFRVKTKRGYKKVRISKIEKTSSSFYSVNVWLGREQLRDGMLVNAKDKTALKKIIKIYVKKYIKKLKGKVYKFKNGKEHRIRYLK